MQDWLSLWSSALKRNCMTVPAGRNNNFSRVQVMQWLHESDCCPAKQVKSDIITESQSLQREVREMDWSPCECTIIICSSLTMTSVAPSPYPRGVFIHDGVESLNDDGLSISLPLFGPDWNISTAVSLVVNGLCVYSHGPLAVKSNDFWDSLTFDQWVQNEWWNISQISHPLSNGFQQNLIHTSMSSSTWHLVTFYLIRILIHPVFYDQLPAK